MLAQNTQLLSTQNELLAEIDRLREQQIKLREKNLRLTQECHNKQQECSILVEQLAQFARRRHSCSQSDLHDRKKKQPVAFVEVKEDVGHETSNEDVEELRKYSRKDNVSSELTQVQTSSEPNLSKIQVELDKARAGNQTSQKPTARSREYVSSEPPSLEEIEVNKCVEGFAAIRQEVLNQLNILQNLSDVLNTQQSLGFNGKLNPEEEDLTSICPICRDSFPSICKNDYESHVLDHFNSDIVRCTELLDLDM
ncbi:hypothetical protein QYM36_003978 [Artemia franciscana]|uniref:UBZ1-type domain-containing protein n=1 Tax=Artemia franciscana TaxID=6661 RepID=A0AA88I5T5_ARTSF|nr:hypothetical protein QYM36_003978 [Artemia franciscana]